MTGQAIAQVYALGVAAAIIWLIVEFYWPRFFAAVILIAAWGFSTLGVSLYLIGMHLQNGDYGAALATLVIGGLMTAGWLTCIIFIREWMAKQRRFGGRIIKPWNARND